MIYKIAKPISAQNVKVSQALENLAQAAKILDQIGSEKQIKNAEMITEVIIDVSNSLIRK